MESYYAKNSASGEYRGCRTFHDFRELLARPDIDAVMISTPDHWHALMAAAAMKAGKDVSLEKPITRSIHEGRILAQLSEKYRRVFRVDSEFRSLEPMHHAAELVRNGRIGKLLRMRTGSPTEGFPKEADGATVAPPELDYELWLGPAPKVDYMTKRVHTSRNLLLRPGWMRNLDYCDGIISNWGTHTNDIAQWGLDTERSGPVEIQAQGKFHGDPVWNVLESYEARFKYASGVELFYNMSDPFVRFEGDRGWIQANFYRKGKDRRLLLASSEEILQTKIPDNGVRFILRSEKEDFIECIKSRGVTLEDAEVGHRTTSLCHLAHISIRLGGAKLGWNPETETFTGPSQDQAQAMVSGPPMRAPWSLETI